MRKVAIVTDEDMEILQPKFMADCQAHFHVYKELCTKHPEATVIDYMVAWRPVRYHLSREMSWAAHLDQNHKLIKVEGLWMN